MVFGLSLVVIITVVGGALDFMNANSVKADMQDALDAAVIAGVTQSSQMEAAARKTFARNVDERLSGATQSYAGASSTTSSPTADVLTLTGTATAFSPTYLLKIVGMDTVKLTASSTAVNTISKGARPCIYVLDPSGSQALLVNSGANVVAPNCEIHVKSTANPAAIFNAGSSLNFKKVCIKGSNVIRNSTTVNKLELGCKAEDDPYAGTLPTPASATCTSSNGNYNGATINMTPGVYCGWFNFNNSNANVKFAPGVYVIKNGGWNVNGGTWTGTGVTFYFADTSKIQFNSGISATLSAPTSGIYKDLLMYEASGLSKSQFVLNDTVANKLTGLIWLPSRELTLNAKSGVQSDSLTLVTWRLILNNTAWNLTTQTTSTGAAGTSKIRLIK
jgi:hypothetical protein